MMRKFLLISLLLLLSNFNLMAQPIIVDHTCTRVNSIPSAWIDSALAKLDIVYTHTSHGSQLTTGMNGLADFKKDQRLDFAQNGQGGRLDLHDYGCGDYGAWDLGNPDRTEWERATRKYLAAYPKTNVVVWSWCGQVESATENDIKTYLNLMSGLERDFPKVRFVYMTGHVIEGATGNNHTRNEQIRAYCRTNNKILYDFADIECYDPDGKYFGDKRCTDGCQYDANGDGNPWNDGANWAVEWQNTHTEGVDWYTCTSEHSEPLNANLKAYAAWWLWARLAGWTPTTRISEKSFPAKPADFKVTQNYPNPFNPATTIEFQLNIPTEISVEILDARGRQVRELVRGMHSAGLHRIVWDGRNHSGEAVASGTYFYKMKSATFEEIRKCLLIK